MMSSYIFHKHQDYFMKNFFKNLQKQVLMAIGTVRLVVGVAGLLLPLLPGVPLLILSEICFGMAAAL
jgi:hypothetical protein